MNRKKSFNDLSESTQEKYASKLHSSWVWDEDAEDLCRDASDNAVRTFIAVLYYMRTGEPGGYLLRGGKAISTDWIARRVGRSGFTQRMIGDGLRELVKLNILAKEDGIYCYPKMVAMFRKQQKRNATNGNGAKSDETSDNGSQRDETNENESSPRENFHEGKSENESSYSTSISSSGVESRRKQETTTTSTTTDTNRQEKPQGGDLEGPASVSPVTITNIAPDVTQTWWRAEGAKLGLTADQSDAATSQAADYWKTQGKKANRGGVINQLRHFAGVGKTVAKVEKPAAVVTGTAESGTVEVEGGKLSW